MGAGNLNTSNELSKIDVSLSVVSHGQIDLVCKLLGDIQQHCVADSLSLEVILTLNIPEQLPFQSDGFIFPIKIVLNAAPKGFGANQNAAFELAEGRYFCVINPDIRLIEDPFPCLINQITGTVGVIAPLVVNPEGLVENSARRFPTPWRVLRKVFDNGRRQDYSVGYATFRPDWVGGMFMLFTQSVFRRMRGFDERYFLYYEDVDLCARMALADLIVLLCPQVKVIHEARRSSHRSLKYAKWHASSMMRFFLSTPFRRLMKRALSSQRKNA